MKTLLPNLLLVSGTGQNTGKTTLVCRLIENISTNTDVVGIKVTNHLHPLTYEMPVFAEDETFKIFKEFRTDQPKDSSRMLKAGAQQVFFVISERENLNKAMDKILNSLDDNTALICESGGLADSFQPGLHLHLSGTTIENTRNIPEGEDLVVSFDGTTFTPGPDRVIFENNCWTIKI